MAKLIKLPTFPPVSQDCLLHPALLSLRYLMDANLPGQFTLKAYKAQPNESIIAIYFFSFFLEPSAIDKLHTLVCEVIQKTSMGKESFLTFDPTRRHLTLLCYDLQAAALIIVTMKLLFGLNDKAEW